MLEFIKKKWVEWLISISVVCISAIVVNVFTLKRDSKAVIQKQIESKASIEYVNKQDDQIYDYVKSQDLNLKDNLQQSIDAQTRVIESMDHKLDILIQQR